MRSTHWALHICSSLIPGTLDEIDVRVVSYNGSNEIVYFPEDFNVFKVVFNDVINAVRMPGPGSLPLFFQYWSFTVNSKEFSETRQSIACEFKVIPSRPPSIHRGDSGESRKPMNKQPGVDKWDVETVTVPCDPNVCLGKSVCKIDKKGLVVCSVTIESFVFVDSDVLNRPSRVVKVTPGGREYPAPVCTKVGRLNIPRNNLSIVLFIGHYLLPEP